MMTGDEEVNVEDGGAGIAATSLHTDARRAPSDNVAPGDLPTRQLSGHPTPWSPAGDRGSTGLIDVTVVLPCLNEVRSVGVVVRAAFAALQGAGLAGEVVVADNGSTDGSEAVALAAGARVVSVANRGYGNACHAGLLAAQGRVLVMADADGTYPMEVIPALVAPVLAGEQDMVIGSRLQGKLAQKSMPWTHRRIGNPILTAMLNRFFGVTVSDAHSGMRAIDADAYRRLGLCTSGMEYASEMIVQAARCKLRVREIPIDYRARIGESKLQTWPDGWRHLKFLLLASPTWLFLLPGLVLFVLGAVLVIPLAIGPTDIGPVHLIIHPLVVGAMLMIIGHEMVLFGVLIRACSPLLVGEADRVAEFVHRTLTLERVLVIGGSVLGAGLAVGVTIFVRWALRGFGPIFEIRPAVAAMTLVVLGAQTIFGGFLYAFFLPSQFGGVTRNGHVRSSDGVAPAVAIETAARPDEDAVPVATTSGALPTLGGVGPR